VVKRKTGPEKKNRPPSFEKKNWRPEEEKDGGIHEKKKLGGYKIKKKCSSRDAKVLLFLGWGWGGVWERNVLLGTRGMSLDEKIQVLTSYDRTRRGGKKTPSTVGNETLTY